MAPSKKAVDTSSKEDLGNATESVKDLGAAAADLGTEAKEQVSNLTDQVRQQATKQLTSQKDQVVDGLETVALLLHQASEHAQQQEKTLIANYVDQAAQQVSSLTESIDQQDITQVLQTTKDFARREPMLFVGGALIAGFLGARFLRSSTEQAEQMNQEQSNNGDGNSGDVRDYGIALPAYDIDQTTSTSSDGGFGATGFSDETKADFPEDEVDAVSPSDIDDLDRSGSL